MNEPSSRSLLRDYEVAMLIFLDSIINGTPINLKGVRVPVSVRNQLEQALDAGKLTGRLESELD